MSANAKQVREDPDAIQHSPGDGPTNQERNVTIASHRIVTDFTRTRPASAKQASPAKGVQPVSCYKSLK